MDARGTRLLRKTAYRGLDLIRCGHHEVGKLVDDYHDLGQRRMLGVSCRDPVVAVNVAYADVLEQLKAVLHLVDRRIERAGGALGIGHDGHLEVRQVGIHAHFDLFWVDHDELHLVGARLVKQADYDAVDAHRFTGSRSTRNEQVRHFGYIEDYHVAGNVFAEARRQLALGVAENI